MAGPLDAFFAGKGNKRPNSDPNADVASKRAKVCIGSTSASKPTSDSIKRVTSVGKSARERKTGEPMPPRSPSAKAENSSSALGHAGQIGAEEVGVNDEEVTASTSKGVSK